MNYDDYALATNPSWYYEGSKHCINCDEGLSDGDFCSELCRESHVDNMSHILIDVESSESDFNDAETFLKSEDIEVYNEMMKIREEEINYLRTA